MTLELSRLTAEVARAARQAGVRIVLAESCTAGLISHLLSRLPGASDWLCGSAVVYRNATKSAWLDVSPAMLADPEIGPVSEDAAAVMCAGILRHTPEATLAASITGHLGPDAPAELDGVAYIGILPRPEAGSGSGSRAQVSRIVLSAALPAESPFESLRVHRQHEAAAAVLQRIITCLREAT